MTNRVLAAVGVATMFLPAVAGAQSLSCAVPGSVPRPRPALPSDKEPVRRLPIGGYTLAVSWSPQFCKSRGGAGRDGMNADFQCGGANSFGFVLHGLWPDGYGKDWPQYCQATPLLSRATIRRNLCSTPSAQLLQHEWAKHGTCMAGYTPDRYFAKSTALFGALRFPDMDALSRQPTLTAGALAQAIAAQNRGLGADMIRVTTTRDGWLDELWLCMDQRLRYARCEPGKGGVDPASALRIWRARP